MRILKNHFSSRFFFFFNLSGPVLVVKLPYIQKMSCFESAVVWRQRYCTLRWTTYYFRRVAFEQTAY